jgi:hypothetical protein
VDAVGANQNIGDGLCTVLETCLDAIAAIAKSDQPMAETNALGRQRAGEGPQQVRAEEVIIGGPQKQPR